VIAKKSDNLDISATISAQGATTATTVTPKAKAMAGLGKITGKLSVVANND